jgi:hypothetical protein
VLYPVVLQPAGINALPSSTSIDADMTG